MEWCDCVKKTIRYIFYIVLLTISLWTGKVISDEQVRIQMELIK